MEEWSKRIWGSAEAMQEQLVSWRRALHRRPEVGFELDATKEFVRKRLVEMGYEPAACGRAGLVVLLGRPGGRTVLLRADMDALPLEEQAEVAYRSETAGRMHACGHDLHTAMLLGAAQLLKQYEDELPGQVKLMFQPAEEIFGGAHDMVEHGVLERPHVDAAMMLHVLTGLPVPSGCFVVPEGGTGSASSDEFCILVKGKGGHGAMPERSIDPINVMAHIHLALQEIHARELAPGKFLVITPGMLRAGEASNVIPDRAEMKGTIRAADAETVAFAKRRICEIAEATARVFRAQAEVTFAKSCPPMIADDALSKAARTYLTELFGAAVLPPMPSENKVGGGSEDFAFVSAEVPAIAAYLGAGNSEEGYTYPPHHPKTAFDDSVLCRGTAAYAYFALRWLQEHREAP